MATQRKIWSDCRTCERSTQHEILFQAEEETDPDGYHEKDSWGVVQCQGCLTIGFHHRNDDYENVREGNDGLARHEISISVYPSVIKNHHRLDASYFLPPLIRKIYFQTITALSERAYILASMGLRATIEAVCNHLELSGAALERRIDQLFKGGHVSNGDKKRLHAIRFLGNDAAHEIKEPKENDLRIALEIVEHLLKLVFILEKRAKTLETVVENYEDFLRILSICAKSYASQQAVSLSALLGRQRRLVTQHFDDFESKLREDIAKCAIPYLTLSQSQQIGGKDVQLYDVSSDLIVDEDNSNEIPF